MVKFGCVISFGECFGLVSAGWKVIEGERLEWKVPPGRLGSAAMESWRVKKIGSVGGCGSYGCGYENSASVS